MKKKGILDTLGTTIGLIGMLTLIGVLLGLVATVCFLIVGVNWGNINYSLIFKGLFFTLAISFILINIGMRMLNTVEKPKKSDKKFVLYIKGFKVEKTPFWFGHPKAIDNEVDYKWTLNDYPFYSFDEFFKKYIEKNNYTFISVNNPNKFIPTLGSSKFSLSEDWKKEIIKISHNSEFIILKIANTKGIIWELEMLKSQKLLTKTYCCIEPMEIANTSYYKFNQLFRDWKQTSVPIFAKQLANIGISFPEKFEYGSLIGFDKYNRGYIIKNKLKKPSEYINAILEIKTN